MSDPQLGNEVLDLGKAIGLFNDGGGLNADWFGNPLTHIEAIFTDDTQRAAFLRVLDALLAPATLPDLPDHETWHPLLSDQTRGNAYLTVNTASNLTFGFAGDFHSTDGPTPLASLRAHLPLLSIVGGNAHAVAGTPDGPLELSLRIRLGLHFGADPIGLDEVVVIAGLTPFGGAQPAALTVELQGLQLDNTGKRNVFLDPSNLGSEAVHLIVAFMQQQLHALGGSGGATGAVADHLLPLLGFGDAAIPQFPFAQLGNPAALNQWFASLLQGGATAPIAAWMQHFARLLGNAAATAAGTGTENDPWVVPIVSFGAAAGSGLNISLATKTVSSITSLLLGLQARVIPSGPNPPLRIEGNAILASIPITGASSASVLPSVSVTATAPGALGAGALVNTPTIAAQSLRAGFTWTGNSLQPMLEIDSVDFTVAGTTTHYARVDLTNADSVASDLSATVGNLVASYLGTSGPGRHLAALIGVVPPATDPASPHHLDFVQMVSNPARAIGAFHRALLLDGAHSWSHLLEEIGGLVGIATAVTGAGTRNDPWVLELAPASGFHVEIAAWNDQGSGVASDPQKLRLGLRASFAQAPFDVYWLSELLAFDLPQGGAGTVSLMAGQHAHVGIQPIPAIPDVAGLSISVGDLAADMVFVPGSPLAWTAGIHNVAVSCAGSSVNVPFVGFPTAAPFDVSNPVAIAAGLGITVPNLELLLRLVLARAVSSWGGVPAYTLAGLLGIHTGLDRLPSDWPTLADPGASGSLLSDPFTAVRNWLQALATGVSSAGEAFLPQLFPWLRGLLADALPDIPGNPLGDFSLPITGAGTYEDPWVLPVTTTTSAGVDALLWLEPAGPPPSWANAFVSAAAGAADFYSFFQTAQSVAAFLPALSDGIYNNDPILLASALNDLSALFATGDGIAHLASQVPASPNWTAGSTLASGHDKQPFDPQAIAQILAQVDTMAGGSGSARTVLLLGPAFSDHTIWNALLADPARHGNTAADTNFNLRVAGLDPSAVDLTTVTAQASWYTADLQDDATGNTDSLVAQIGRLVDRVQQLNGSTPVTLVAHSTAGIAALKYTQAHASLIQGLITVGTPHLGSSLDSLAETRIADALRVIKLLRDLVA
ncbi:MAG TPA: hypothetical protein VGL22_11690, partial [Terracidiphilus sp.]